MITLSGYHVLSLNPKLTDLCMDVDREFGEGVYTSAFRPYDTGVHGTIPLRAIDRRCRNEKVGKLMAALINELWRYDDERPHLDVAVFHDTGLGPHLHLQVHRNTRRIT